MAENTETEKIHDQVTWPESYPIFDDGTGGLAFPEQNNSNYPDGYPSTVDVKPVITYDGVIDDSGVVLCKPSYSMKIEPDKIYVRLTSFVCGDYKTFSTLDGYVDTAFAGLSATIIPNTEDTLQCTELLNCKLTNIYPMTHIPGSPLFNEFGYSDIENPPTNQFDWIAPDDGLVTFDLAVELSFTDQRPAIYVELQHQDNPSENGLYRYTSGIVQKVASAGIPESDSEHSEVIDQDDTVNDNVPCCNHFRKTYSHEEASEYVKGQIGDVASFGVKSMSVTDCDGGFIDWFTTDGEVNIGNGHVPLFVNGFGLGQFYRASGTNVDTKDALPRDDYEENDNTRHPWLTWAYGTRSDARTTTNLVALPRDWPFHVVSESSVTKYDEVTDTNNITFVKCGVDGSSTIGNLEYDREDSEGNDEHVLINRHHVVLYPEFSDLDGKVIVKPTFIHLPASMDTKDGETIELTVSIQNVDQNSFGSGDNAVTLSGYYAAMSQPRVYVMGGVQKFSNKRMPVDKGSIEQHFDVDGTDIVYTEYVLSTPIVAKSATGEPLETGTQVRANILVSKANATGERRKFVASGYILSIDSDGSSSPSGGTVFSFKGKFPYDINGRGWNNYVFTICGIAYLDDEDNPTETKMGIVSRDDDVMKGDEGTGSADELDEFNKFLAVSSDNDGRTNLPHVDKRYLLATVYQSATNTFPWEFVGRHRMSKLSRNWSDEHHRNRGGFKSLVHLIYEQDQKLYDTFKSLDDLAKYIATDAKYWTYAKYWPASYSHDNSWSWTSLGSVLQVQLSTNINTPITAFYGNPVRQASRAIQNFANDFNHMRLLSASGNKKARVQVTGILVDRDSGEWPSADETIIDTAIKPDTSSTAWMSEFVNSAWCANVRSLPDYVLRADEDSESHVDGPVFVSNSMCSYDINAWSTYLANLPYNANSDSPYKASACIDEEPNTVLGTPRDYEVYSGNSVCEQIADVVVRKTNNLASWVNDIRRYTETVLAVKIDDSLMNLPLTTMMYMAGNKTLDWMIPFTNIASLDGAPIPYIGLSTLDSLVDAQQEYASFDAVQMYRYGYRKLYPDSSDTISDVSTIMPPTIIDGEQSVALSNFIQKYVATYGAEMYKHVYQGNRILLKNGKLPSETEPIYLRSIDRVNKRNTDASDFVDRYIMDNFAAIGSDTRDSNVDRSYVSASSISMTAMPYSHNNGAQYSNKTYTRVFMQFTFSQKAGRWYTTDYRQYPTNYLTPLYGADALDAGCYSIYDGNGSIFTPTEETPVNIRPLWVNSACVGFNSYRSHCYAPYSVVPPMDITLGCVPYMYGADPTDDANPSDDPLFPYDADGKLKPEWEQPMVMSRLESPYKLLTEGGIGLYPPANALGGHNEMTDSGIHANFWSVRKFIRPAVSVLKGTDIPTYASKDGDTDPEHSDKWRNGGDISDPTLYDMFDFPVKGEKVYVMPNEVDPEDDTALQILLYRNPGETEDGRMENRSANVKHYMGYGVSAEAQELDE